MEQFYLITNQEKMQLLEREFQDAKFTVKILFCHQGVVAGKVKDGLHLACMQSRADAYYQIAKEEVGDKIVGYKREDKDRHF